MRRISELKSQQSNYIAGLSRRLISLSSWSKVWYLMASIRDILSFNLLSFMTSWLAAGAACYRSCKAGNFKCGTSRFGCLSPEAYFFRFLDLWWCQPRLDSVSARLFILTLQKHLQRAFLAFNFLRIPTNTLSFTPVCLICISALMHQLLEHRRDTQTGRQVGDDMWRFLFLFLFQTALD